MKGKKDMKYLAEEQDCKGLNDFFVFGINYSKASADIRGLYAIDAQTAERILSPGFTQSATDLIILSTCNRTEIYGLGDMESIIDAVSQTIGRPSEVFYKNGYQYKAKSAVLHLFKVASGLDSQILGDFEIAGQLKQAAMMSKKTGRLSNLTERLVNYALRASKEVKSNTQLSKGTVSASYAAIELIQDLPIEIKPFRILLVGLGSFGENVAKNICHYLPSAHFTVANRTLSKAENFARFHRCDFIPFDEVAKVINDFDVVINSASVESPYILANHVKKSELYFLDMSIPGGIDPAVTQRGATYYNIDHISAILNKTLSARQAEVPRAMKIIHEHILEFVEWHKIYLQRWLIYRAKDFLYNLDCAESYLPKEKKVQNAVNHLVINIKKDNYIGCHFLGAINEYLKN